MQVHSPAGLKAPVPVLAALVDAGVVALVLEAVPEDTRGSVAAGGLRVHMTSACQLQPERTAAAAAPQFQAYCAAHCQPHSVRAPVTEVPVCARQAHQAGRRGSGRRSSRSHGGRNPCCRWRA